MNRYEPTESDIYYAGLKEALHLMDTEVNSTDRCTKIRSVLVGSIALGGFRATESAIPTSVSRKPKIHQEEDGDE